MDKEKFRDCPNLIKYADAIKCASDAFKKEISDRLWEILKVELENQSVHLFDEHQGKSCWDVFLDRVISTDENHFNFFLRYTFQENDRNIYVGIGLDNKAFYGRYRNHYAMAWSTPKNEPPIRRCRPYWSGGKFLLLNMTEAWFLKMFCDKTDSLLDKEAVDLSFTVFSYIKLVTKQWNACFQYRRYQTTNQ